MDLKSTKAAVVVQSCAPLAVDRICLPDRLDFLQVLVKIHTTTICGAQINEIDAVKGPDKFLPHLLGHEAFGEVLEIGPYVSSCKVGDFVVLHWRPGKGMQAKPAVYSRHGHDINAGWVTTFQQFTVVSENRVTPVPADTDRRLAPLLGCALTTALGVVNNNARVKLGDSVLVIGAGGVGLPIIQMALAAGAHPVYVIENDEVKTNRAVACGAERWWGCSADVVVETTGDHTLIALAYAQTAKTGRCVLVGVPKEKATIPTLPLHFGKVLTGSEGGSCNPAVDIPKVLELIRVRKLNFDWAITHEFPLDKINDALDLMRTGKAGRILIDMAS